MEPISTQAASPERRPHLRALPGGGDDVPTSLRQAFETSPLGMALVDLDGRFALVNAALCELTGYDEDELLERGFQDLVHRGDIEAVIDRVHAMLAGEVRAESWGRRLVRADGRHISAMIAVSLLRGADGEPAQLCAQLYDARALTPSRP
jgi:PAS domain S-box-containing protein